MNATSSARLWGRLRQAGLVEGEGPPAADVTPWFVRLMLGVSGWIGALFILIFLGVLIQDLFDSGALELILSFGALGVAWNLYRYWPHNDFAVQFGLAVSLAGQTLFVLSLGEIWGHDAWIGALLVGGLEVALFWVMPNLLHRVWSAAAAGLALLVFLAEIRIHALGSAILALLLGGLWLREFGQAATGPLFRAAGYGLALALLADQVGTAWGMFDHAWPVGGENHLDLTFGRALTGAALVAVAGGLLRRESVRPSSGVGVASLVICGGIAVIGVAVPGLAAATLLLVLGFANGNALLSGVGLLSMLAAVAFYYLTLEATLLFKSGMLVCMGLGLFGARALLPRWRPTGGAEGDDHA